MSNGAVMVQNHIARGFEGRARRGKVDYGIDAVIVVFVQAQSRLHVFEHRNHNTFVAPIELSVVIARGKGVHNGGHTRTRTSANVIEI